MLNELVSWISQLILPINFFFKCDIFTLIVEVDKETCLEEKDSELSLVPVL